MGLPAEKICTCLDHNNVVGIYNRQSRYDPTRTLTLRNAFVQQMNKRFRKIRGIIRKAIIEDDCFGLNKDRSHLVFQVQFDFPRSQDKITGFMNWLKQQEDLNIIETIRIPQIGRSIEAAWTDVYIRDSYKRGVIRARNELKNAGYDVPGLQETGGIEASMSAPFHADRVGLLYTRTFNGLKGITDAMDNQISQVLAQGLADGDNPRLLAKKLLSTVSGPFGDLGITDTLGRFIPAERRAQMLARTEVIRAHHQATIQEYKNWAAEGVKVKAEWVTAGYNVCPECAMLEGQVFKLTEIENKLPLHPNCRCIAIPLDVTDEKISEIEKTIQAQEQPMNVIGNMNACLPRILVQIGVYAPPQACSDYVREGKKWKYQGQEIADEKTIQRLSKLRLPPAWKNVVVAKDASAKIQAIGLDKAGRWQYRYSETFVGKQARKKFDRVKSFSRDMPGIERKINDGIAQGHTEAYLLRMESKTAIRAGSDVDFKARKKAYGLTTLQNEHVVISGNKINLNFIAKEGKQATYELTDEILAPWLKERKAMTTAGEKLFSDSSALKVNSYLKELVGGKKYTIKDFRTYHGTRIAKEELKKYAGKELSEKERKRIVKEVSEKASQFLHNTPIMAKNSYIDPMVWDYIGGLP